VKWIDEVLQVALTHLPVPLPAPPDPVKPAEVIAGEKPARKPARAKGQVRAH
jgi:hypothetical protein